MLRVCRLGVLLSLVVLGASPTPVSGAVESGADVVTHSASSGTTKLWVGHLRSRCRANFADITS